MGCGASRFGPEGEALPLRLRPLFHLRIEEIRRRRNDGAIKGTTLSKKELLHDTAGEDDENSVPRNDSDLNADVIGRKSVCLPNETEPLLKEADLKESEKVKEKEEDERVLKADAVMAAVAEVETEEEEVEEEGEDEDEGRLSNDEDCMICPGSPSFRVYYIDSLADDDHKDGDDCKNDSRNNQSQGDESVASRHSNEGSVNKTQKKGKKGRRFRRVMCKGGPGAVKHLLNVRSCYNPAPHSHHETQPLAAKTAA